MDDELADTDAGGFGPDPDTDMTSLEQQLFGMKVFDEDAEGVLEDPNEQHTMLHRNPSEADTVFQQGLGVPQVAVADTRIVPGTKRTEPAPPRRASEPPAPGRIVAVGGVAAFSGAFVAGGFALVGMVVLVLVLYLRPGASPSQGPTSIDGVPAPAAEAPSASEAIRFPATFRGGDTTPREVDGAALAALAVELGACPGAIRITGHADQSGSSAANDAVALGRAAEVRKLLAQAGLAPGRLQLASVGAAEPEFEDDSREARELNRRVVVQCE